MLDFYKIVKILWKKWWNIFFKQNIFELIDPEKKEKYSSKVDKIIYRLKAEWYIFSLKAWVYIVPNEEDKQMNKIELIDKYYMKLAKKYITFYAGSHYYISGIKALEIHNRDFSIPEKLYVVTRNVNKKITLGSYEIIFKTLKWKHQGKSYNLYAKFENFTTTKKIENIDFKLANIELALVEWAILTDIEESLKIRLLTKMIKKYGSIFDGQIFYEIGKYKYIMSFNRLKEIAKKQDEWLYLLFLDVIKKNGGLFIGEGLRGF